MSLFSRLFRVFAVSAILSVFPGSRAAAAPVPTTLIVRLNELALEAAKAHEAAAPIVARTLALMHLGFLDLDRKAGLSESEKEAAEVELARLALRTFLPSQARKVDREAERILREYSIEPSARTDAAADAEMSALEDWRLGDERALAAGAWTKQDPRTRWNPLAGQAPEFPNWGKAPSFLESRPPNWRVLVPSVAQPEPRLPGVALTLELGAADSRRRTAEMGEIAKFWSQGPGTVTPIGQWNRVARDAADRMRLLHSEEIRLFAELNVALAEATIHCWKNRYDLLVLRPIQVARLDGREDWKPFLPTPALPEYPSGHATFAAAAAEVLTSWAQQFKLPTGRPGAVRVVSEDLPGVVREFPDFRAAAREAGMSGIYAGHHFRWSHEEGQILGRKIAVETMRDLNRAGAAPRRAAGR